MEENIFSYSQCHYSSIGEGMSRTSTHTSIHPLLISTKQSAQPNSPNGFCVSPMVWEGSTFTPFSNETPSMQSPSMRHINMPPPPQGGDSGDQFPIGDGMGILLLLAVSCIIARFWRKLRKQRQ